MFRRLRAFAVDPSIASVFETPILNEATLEIPWEDLEPGPIGDYVAVVDEDESGRRVHEPVDLDRPECLALDGLPPSDGDPHFRQQMAYAVTMRTIDNFERALGRVVHWVKDGPIQEHAKRRPYVRRLTLSPHYMQEANAWHDPEHLAVRFGYFVSNSSEIVFSCLSQDVIAHEVTHALLLGLQVSFGADHHDGVEDPVRRSKPRSNAHEDPAAFHKALACLVASLQHFTEGQALTAQIAAIAGDLRRENALGAIATQFGQAFGQHHGLRNALGSRTEKGVWLPRQPDPEAYQRADTPHARGEVLFHAVFEAFRMIYERRVAGLHRVARTGTQGQVSPDLANRLAREAAATAKDVLEMCIQAIDYLPPLAFTFGDFLRALLTADHDLDPRDEERHRIAFLDAFRRYGILPFDTGTLSVETLLWPRETGRLRSILMPFMKKLAERHSHWTLPRDRAVLWELLEDWRLALAKHLKSVASAVKRIGCVDLRRPFEVWSFQPRIRLNTGGGLSAQWVIKLRQHGRVGKRKRPSPMIGCTLLVCAESGTIRHRIDSSRVETLQSPVDPLVRGSSARTAPLPEERRLRVFAFDPSLGIQLDTAQINEVTLRVPWERDAHENDRLERGPIGEYVEVIDRDPSSRCFYAPVDLNHPHLLAENGLPPSEGNPQFHQQMTYAVAMRTIKTFERALGRRALWAPNRIEERGADGRLEVREEHVPRLRLYPHALRESNAYYSPAKKAVLFGYFPGPGGEEPTFAARPTVFTCLSHDIVAHEVTHALLDGMHTRFREASNPDVLAFHEGFADVVALFLHFSLPSVLRHQIALTRGDLSSQNRLGELAQQFGQATGKRGALRSAIGTTDPTGRWMPLAPDPDAYRRTLDPHARGAILVAAVFDAFLTMYRSRIADLLRIASHGTGILPAGALDPTLVDLLSTEAALSAQHVLDMCIRALDYCPPVDITFGDYLRAIITSDFESDPVDRQHRRVAFVEAFRRRGIVPEDVRTLSIDGLLWRPTAQAPDENESVVLGLVKSWASHITAWNLKKDCRELFELMRSKRAELHEHLVGRNSQLAGIVPELPIEVHSVRPSVRCDRDGRSRLQWVIELTQRLPQWHAESNTTGGPDYYLRGGSTLLVDAETGKVRYTIRKPLDDVRRLRQKNYLAGVDDDEGLAASYFRSTSCDSREPFAMLHRL